MRLLPVGDAALSVEFGDAIDPALNAVQSMVAVQKGGSWKIALFQNTPAAYHQRPDLAKQLTEELRGKVRQRPVRE